jgi:hypothetical protein
MAGMEIADELNVGRRRVKKQRPREGMTRDVAANIIVRDWLQGQGFLPILGEGTRKTPEAVVRGLRRSGPHSAGRSN